MGGHDQTAGRRPDEEESSAARPEQLEAWCTHIRSLVTDIFGTHKAAAARIGKSTTWLSRGLSARRSDDQTRMPGRDFVDKVLVACGTAATDDLRETTRVLYMEALAVTHPDRHAECLRADEAAATQARCEDVTRALAGFEARCARERDQHAHDIARVEAEKEQVAQEAVAALAEAQTRNGELTGQLAEARLRIVELTEQLAEERQGRQWEQDTIRALRRELLGVQEAMAALEVQPCRHEREEAVVAEALAITEQALTAEQKRIAAGAVRADTAQQAKRSAALPAIVSVTGFVVMIVGMLTGLATVIDPHTAAQLNWELVDALQGNTGAKIAAVAAAVIGMSAAGGGLFTLTARGHLTSPARTNDSSAQVTWATWI